MTPMDQTAGRNTKVHIRRTRRTDFTAVMQLIAASGAALPPPDRATLRRFRNLVNDLGTDFYLALVDDALVGLVHVTYARQLSAAPSARVEQLLVAESHRRRGIGRTLLAFAEGRARKRGCVALASTLRAHESTGFFAAAGFQSIGTVWCQKLETGDR